MSERADAFLAELGELYQKHGISISHEDCHGNFILEPISEDNIEWMEQATIRGFKSEPKPEPPPPQIVTRKGPIKP